MEFFDSHMHIDDSIFDQDREEVLQKIYKQGVTKAIDLGCDIQSSKKVLQIANQTDFIYAAVGLHPEEIPQNEDELWKILDEIKNLAINNKKVGAIGEIG